MNCTTRKKKDAASPSPSSPFLSFQISAAFLLHPSHSDIFIIRTFSAPLLYLLENLIMIPFRCSLQPEFVFHRAKKKRPCLSLNTCTSCLVFRHLLSNSTKPFSCAFHLARLATHTSSSPCLKILKIFWPFSFIACWTTCLMDFPTCSDMSSYSCKPVTPASHHHCLLGISAFSWPSSRKRYSAFACLPSRPTGLLPPWMKANFAAAMAFSGSSRGHHSLILNIMPFVWPTLLLCNVFP